MKQNIKSFLKAELESLIPSAEQHKGPFTTEEIFAELARRDEMRRRHNRLTDPERWKQKQSPLNLPYRRIIAMWQLIRGVKRWRSKTSPSLMNIRAIGIYSREKLA